MKDVTASLAMLVAVDLDKVGTLLLGSMLRSSNVVSCIFSTLYTSVNVTEFSFDFDSLSELNVAGMNATSLTNSIGTVTTIIMDNYGEEINEAIPFLVEIASLAFISEIIKELESDSCPPPINFSGDRCVDFRDLLLSPTAAEALGGNGTSLYGDVAATLKELVDDLLLSLSDNSSSALAINDLIILAMKLRVMLIGQVLHKLQLLSSVGGSTVLVMKLHFGYSGII